MNGANYITNFKGLTLWQASADELPELAKFVVWENYAHHKGKSIDIDYYKNESSPYYDEYISVLKEEKKHFNYSASIIARNQDGIIVGTIRVMKWNENPNEIALIRLFGDGIINKEELLANFKHVWHIGRFSVGRDCKEKATLFRLLMVYAISPIFQYKEGVLLAEIDEKLLRVMKLMKIQAESLSGGIEYLGSVTIPVMIKKQGLEEFLFESLSIALNFRYNNYEVKKHTINDQKNNLHNATKNIKKENTLNIKNNIEY